MESIGLDIGTNWTRASLFSSSGRLLRHHSTRTGVLHSPVKGYVEINPETVFRNVSFTLKQLLSGIGKRELVLSLSCMAPVLILLDSEWKCICNALLYNDVRSSREVDEINREFGENRLLSINGNACNVQQWLPKLRWMQKKLPSAMKKAAHLMDLSSYLIFRLSGENVIDLTVAQEAGLLDFSSRKWSSEILDYMSIDEEMLPELRKTDEIVGSVKKRTLGAVGSASGMKSILLSGGCVDAVASTLSAGIVKENTAAVVLGSTGIISYATHEPIVDRRLYLDLSPIQGLYYVGGGTASAGIFLDYIAELMLGALGDERYVEKLILSSPPGARGLLMLPYIIGERTPILDPDAKGVIFGMSSTHRKADYIRAAVEGIGYSILDHFKVLRELGYFPSSVKLTGGAARSRVWRQILADMIGVPMIFNEKISGAMGAAFIGYMATGDIRDWGAVEDWIMGWKRYEPRPELNKLYERYFEIYRKIYRATSDSMKMLNGINGK